LRILDVGCGLGFLLDVCEAAGMHAEGCDINEKAVRHANRQTQRVRLGTWDDFYQDSTFDIVFALNVIEHLPHPRSFFCEVRRVLRAGGLFVLETPTQESLFIGWQNSRTVWSGTGWPPWDLIPGDTSINSA
jgi:2-polyprenyl-3-methyl-5-hydroxy-6-metoxy-1,4-benzoquinol methylase